MVITHREYIRDIAPSQGFVKYEFPIQPGLGLTFPWLAQLAESYEEYRIRACVFEFKSLCSDSVISNGTSAGMGSVIMATNYNPNNNPFIDKRTMENYEGSSGRKPSQSNIHVVNVKKASNPLTTKWVRTGGIDDNEDMRLYDIGTFTLATIGQDVANTGVIGELWVAYEIEFFKPKYSGAIGSNLLYDHYSLDPAVVGNFVAGATQAVFGSNSQLAPMTGRNPGLRPNQNRGCDTYISASAVGKLDTINWKAQHQGMTFLVCICYIGSTSVTNTVCVSNANQINTSVTQNNWFRRQTTSVCRSGPTVGATPAGDTVMFMQYVRVLNHPTGPWTCQFQFANPGGGIPGDPTCDIVIMQVDGQDQPTNQ